MLQILTNHRHMQLDAIKLLLKTKIGLNAEAVGDSSIERAIRARLADAGVTSTEEYIEFVGSNNQELLRFIDEVVVPETWFYRNTAPFENFSKHIAKILADPKRSKDNPIRVLSIPCSTGEEPYSLAISLIESGIDTRNIHIEAIDISKRSIALAKKGLYTKNAFRELDDALLNRYFKSQKQGYQLNDRILELVNFKQSNFVIGSLSPHPAYYDIIFCRNLLIYFDRELQKKSIEKLYRALKPGGILYVGHAESAQIDSRYFSGYSEKKIFAFRRLENNEKLFLDSIDVKKKSNRKTEKHWEKAFSEINTLKQSLGTKKKKGVGRKKKANDKLSDQSEVTSISISYIEKLANNGKYAEAKKLAGEYLSGHLDSAEAYYLIGMMKVHEGEEDEAKTILKKSLYLDPNHEQTIILLKILADRSSNQDMSDSYERRLTRIRERKEK